MKSILYILLLFPFAGITQSKAELIATIDQQKATIDSLKKVNANYDNIIENRDRSIKILKEDKTELTQEKEELGAKVNTLYRTISTLENQASQGQSKLIQLSNQSAKFTVAAGKTVVLNQLLADYTSIVSTDSLGNTVAREVHVFLKGMNGERLTNLAQNQYGPQLFSSQHPEHTIQLPIILEENTQIEILVLEGPLTDLQPFAGKVLISYTEK